MSMPAEGASGRDNLSRPNTPEKDSSTVETSDRVSKRITDLELLFTHLERQVADLHDVVLRQQHRLEAAEKQIRALRRQPEEDDLPPNSLEI
jgi:uncharacterized coiled-coil protein SlyX